jgi:hypothetical protein
MSTLCCDIAGALDVLETKNRQVVLWPDFEMAGRSEKLDQLWAVYAQERRRARVDELNPDQIDLILAQYYGERVRLNGRVTNPHHIILAFKIYLDRLNRAHGGKENITTFPAAEYRKLKPYARARAALVKAILQFNR